MQKHTPPSNSPSPQIVDTKSEALNEINAARIVAAASIRGTRTRVRLILTTVTALALVLFVFYESFLRLTAGLRGWASSNFHRLTHTYPIKQSFMSAGFPIKDINAALEYIVVAQKRTTKKKNSSHGV